MEMNKITKSKMLSQIGYDETSHKLQLRFKESDSLYTYFNVPKILFDRFMRVKRKGEFFNKNIKASFAYRQGRSKKLMIPIKGYTQIRNGIRIKVAPYIKTTILR